MSLDLAAQVQCKWHYHHTFSFTLPQFQKVLSKSVADALKFDGKPGTEETECFVRTFDKFFDVFNVRSLNEYIFKRKPNLCPYTSANDKRLKVGTQHAGYVILLYNYMKCDMCFS